jgi:hypothetical protein
MTYTSKDNKVTITIRQQNARQIAWAHYVDGSYKGSKVLPKNNTAVVQNFGYNKTYFA